MHLVIAETAAAAYVVRLQALEKDAKPWGSLLAEKDADLVTKDKHIVHANARISKMDQQLHARDQQLAALNKSLKKVRDRNQELVVIATKARAIAFELNAKLAAKQAD